MPFASSRLGALGRSPKIPFAQAVDLSVIMAIVAALVRFPAPSKRSRAPFSIVEATIADTRAALEEGGATAGRYFAAHGPRRAAIGAGRRAGGPPARRRRRRGAPARAAGGAGAGAGGRCTASRSRSRTTSTPPTCRPPAARWRSPADSALRGDADDEPARRGRDHHRQDRR